MADKDDKTEEPSEKKKQEARQKGQVATSQDFQYGIKLCMLVFALLLFGTRTNDLLKELLVSNIKSIQHFQFSIDNLVAHLKLNAFLMLNIIYPFMITFLLTGLVVTILQVGLLFTPEKLQPKMSNVFSMKNFQQIISKKTYGELLKGLAKIGVVSILLYRILASHYEEFVYMIQMEFMEWLGLFWDITIELCWKLGLAFLLIGLIDLYYKKKNHKEEMKMTKQEVKDERRMSEGDPKVKQKMRQVMMQMYNKMMMNEVPEATVVITNPTFIAIALKYQRGGEAAPKVVAKGKRLQAERIRDLAKENGVPVIENKELARGMYDLVEAGDEIPAEFFNAVAEVLAYVYSQNTAV